MNRISLSLFSLLLLMPLVSGFAEGENRDRIAVIYFQNTGGGASYDPLQKALADMMITDLSQVPSLQIIERTRVGALLNEKEFTVAMANDKENRTTVAKALDVQKTLAGRFSVDEGKQLDIKTGFVETETNKLEVLASVKGPVEEFFKLQKKLVFSVVDKMGIKLSDEERKKIEIIKTENLLAMMAYGRGIDAEDRGDYAAAQKAYGEAAALDPNFKLAADKAAEAGQKADAAAGEKSAEAQTGAEDEKPPVEISGSGPAGAVKNAASGVPADVLEPDPGMAARTAAEPSSMPAAAPTGEMAPSQAEPLSTAPSGVQTTPSQAGAPPAAAAASEPPSPKPAGILSVTGTAIRLTNRAGGAFMPEVGVEEMQTQEAAQADGQETTSAPAASSQGGQQEVRSDFVDYSQTSLGHRKQVKVTIPIPNVP